MNPWIYNNKIINEISDMPNSPFGFVYEVTHTPTGRKYLGKKQLIFVRKKPLGKKELAQLVDGRAKKYKMVEKESDWKSYHGSHNEIQSIIKDKKYLEFTREILKFVPTKKLLTYYETKYLFQNGVLEPDSNYLNDNIEGRYFKKDFAPLN